MNIRYPDLHPWNVSPKEAFEIQSKLLEKVILRFDSRRIRSVAGADIALDLKSGEGIGGVIVYTFPDLEEVERVSGHVKLSFPYVPGLLAFREAPVLIEVFKKLKNEPDLVIFDGQGRAHPRRMGIATHLGIILDKPSIGCAKSRLIGEYEEPKNSFGDYSALMDRGDRIGAVLRTRKNVKPIFISPGHRMDLEKSIEMIKACCDGYRIPKPTREADHFVESLKRGQKG